MRFYCPACKKEIKRDMRRKSERVNLTKRGYKTYCDFSMKTVIAKRIGG